MWVDDARGLAGRKGEFVGGETEEAAGGDVEEDVLAGGESAVKNRGGPEPEGVFQSERRAEDSGGFDSAEGGVDGEGRVERGEGMVWIIEGDERAIEVVAEGWIGTFADGRKENENDRGNSGHRKDAFGVGEDAGAFGEEEWADGEKDVNGKVRPDGGGREGNGAVDGGEGHHGGVEEVDALQRHVWSPDGGVERDEQEEFERQLGGGALKDGGVAVTHSNERVCRLSRL